MLLGAASLGRLGCGALLLRGGLPLLLVSALPAGLAAPPLLAPPLLAPPLLRDAPAPVAGARAPLLPALLPAEVPTVVVVTPEAVVPPVRDDVPGLADTEEKSQPANTREG